MTEFIDKTIKEGKKEKKPTELIKYLYGEELCTALSKPMDFIKLELICRKSEIDYLNFDLIFATNNNGDKLIYFGHWNDGC